MAELTAEEWTPEQVEEFKRAMALVPPPAHRVIEPPPRLTPDEIRQILRECVTVVKPGETLIVRVPVTWNPEQVSNYQANFNDWAAWLELPFRAIVVIGEELGVAEGSNGG